MCKPGNGTIFAQCRDRIQNILGGPASNREMRAVLSEYDGCIHRNGAKRWEETAKELAVREDNLTVALP